MLHLVLGDCMTEMFKLPKVDLVLADLPYGTTQCKWDTPLPLPELWELYRHICTGPIVLFAQTPFDKVLGASNLRDLKYEWIWEKTAATGHLNAKRAPMKAHENILVFRHHQMKYNPIKTHGHVRKTARRAHYKTQIYSPQLKVTEYDSTERYPRSVLKFASDKQLASHHSTQKPVALLDYLIRTYTDPGDVVLDNVMGSGSTGVAAVTAGRGFIGIEKDPEFFAVARQRIRRAAMFA
jgi:hypothetical protein